MVNRRQVIKSAAAAATVLAMPKYAFAASTFTGFYPAGNWIPAKQAMIQVYPRPDSETNTWARHRWAYYDGVNAVQYKIPLGVSFGAFPYVFQLLSGPPGMTIGAAYWQSGWSFAQAMTAGYGYLQWTPSASVSGTTVSILVTDQQMNTLTITFTVSTSSSTSQFIFIDSVHGNDSTGTGTIGAPWASFSKAFGPTYAASVNAKTLCYFRAGTYAIPVYSDNDINSSDALCELNTTTKPSALMGFPGDTPPILTMTAAQFATPLGAGLGADLFMQGLNPNGACTSGGMNGRFIWVAGAGTASYRQTFDSIAWSNPVYGSGGSNATGYFFDGAASSSLTLYQFVNNCSESNRQSGNPGNNYGGCSFYSAQYALVQGCSIIQSGLNMDAAYYFKVNVIDSCIRGCTVNVGAGNVTHAFDMGQPLLSGNGPANTSMTNDETCYNTLVGGGGIFLGFGAFTFGSLWCYRNSVIGPNSFKTNATGGGPLVYDSNAAQGGSFPSGSSMQTNGLNLVKASGLLDSTTGNLTAAYVSYLGTVGAQISLASSAMTPKSPLLSVS
jgi:hypothetical protein